MNSDGTQATPTVRLRCDGAVDKEPLAYARTKIDAVLGRTAPPGVRGSQRPGARTVSTPDEIPSRPNRDRSAASCSRVTSIHRAVPESLALNTSRPSLQPSAWIV